MKLHCVAFEVTVNCLRELYLLFAFVLHAPLCLTKGHDSFYFDVKALNFKPQKS
jgi:hypothetical protein